MKISNRRRGVLNYVGKKIARKYLRVVSGEHVRTKDQLVMFSFDVISQQIAIDGRFENNELSLIERIFKEKMGGKLTLDIGANIGNHTVALSKFSTMVYAFEPNPLVFDVLKLNTKNIENVRLFNFGASDENQSIMARVPKLNCGEGSVSLNENISNSNAFYEYSFTLKSLDQLDALTGKDVGLIKIDVEGHELQAFRGMRSLLERNKPVILFEQNRDIYNGTSAVVDFLKSIGYSQLYAFTKIEEWITPSWLPKILILLFKFLEVLIIGEPSNELTLKPITTLNKKRYDMLIVSFEKIDAS